MAVVVGQLRASAPRPRLLKSGRTWGDAPPMHAAALELAQRTSTTAGPFAVSLAQDCRSIAQTMRMGELGHALATFESTTDRLQRFLTFVVVSSELLRAESPSIGIILADYGRRVLALLDRVQTALDRNDLVDLTLVLEHGLGPALGDYHGYATHVSVALAGRHAA
jgi:hypothetical protein